jgi:hypothetical protein
MTSWQPPAWDPRVGVGADEPNWWEPGGAVGQRASALGSLISGASTVNLNRETEEERRRREAELGRYAWNPAERIGQVGEHLRRAPLAGAVEAAILPLEAAGTAWRTLAGGGAVTAGQAISRALGDEPVGALPARNVQEALDPTRMRARFEESLGDIPKLGFDVTMPVGAPIRAAAHAARPGVRAAGNAIAPGWNVEQPLILPQYAGALKQTTEALSRPGVERTLKFGVPGAAALQAGTEYTEDEPIENRLIRAGVTALGGLAIGAGISGLVGRANKGAQDAYIYTAMRDQSDSPQMKAFLDNKLDAARAAHGGAANVADAPVYKGGYMRLMWDEAVRGNLTDNLARLETMTSGIEDLYKAAGKAYDPGQDPYKVYRGLAAIEPKAKRAVDNEIVPIFTSDVTREQVPMFDSLRQLGQAMELIQEGKGAGRGLDDLATVRGLYDEMTAKIDKMAPGQNLAQKWVGMTQGPAEVPAGHVRLYRGEYGGAKATHPEWVQQGMEESGAAAARGRWFTQDPEIAQWYVNEAGGQGRVTTVDLPIDEAAKWKVEGNPAIARYSRDPANEYFLPSELAAQAAPPGMKWHADPNSTMGRYTQKLNDMLLAPLRDAGVLSAKQFDDITSKRDMYVARRAVEALRDNGFMEDDIPKAGARVATGSGIGRYVDTAQLEYVSLDQDLQRIPRIMAIIEKAKAGNALAQVAEDLPDWGDKYARRIAKQARGPGAADYAGAQAATRVIENVISGGGTRIDARQQGLEELQKVKSIVESQNTYRTPPGWEVVPLKWEDGKSIDYQMPSYAADFLKNINQEKADALTGFMERFSRPFRMGATVMSIPFILADPPRNFMQAWRQNKALSDLPPLQVMQHTFGAWADGLVDGVDQWFQRNHSNPIVANLQERMWQGVQNGLANSRARVDEFYQAGGAGGTIYEGVSRQTGPKSMQDMLQYFERGAPTKIDWARDGASFIVKTPFDMIKALAFAGENATRMAVFRAEKGAGSSEAMAAYQARNAPFDFAKSGSLVKLLNSWMPFTNAHVQGTSQAFTSAWQDPEGYAVRSAMTEVIPQIGTYAWNRLAFPGMLEKIPQWKRDSQFNIIVGTYTSGQGEELPITVSLKKDQAAIMATTPLEHFLDAVYHTKNGQMALAPDQRTERDAGQMWLSTLLNLVAPSPAAVDVTEQGFLPATGMAFITGSPLLGTVAQAMSNQDQFRHQPIIDPSLLELPSQFQTGPQTSKASQILSRVFSEANIPFIGGKIVPAPSMTDFIVSNFGGTLGGVAIHSLDPFWEPLAAAGLVPSQAMMKPQSRAELGLKDDVPDAKVQEYLSRIPAIDSGQPWWTRIAVITATAGSAQSIRQKVARTLSPDDNRAWLETENYWKAYEPIQIASMEHIQNIANDPEKQATWTHEQFMREKNKVSYALRKARENLHGQFPHAITDPRDREAFHARLPGLPVNVGQVAGELPQGLTAEALYQGYKRTISSRSASSMVSHGR